MAGGQVVGGVVSKVGGVTGGLGKALGSIISLIFLRWRITITLIFLAISLSGVIIESVQDKNFAPIVFSVGDRLVSADEGMYWRLKEIEANDWKISSESIEVGDEGFWKDFRSISSKTSFLFYILSTGWYIYVVTYFFFWLIRWHNQSEGVFNIMFAIFVVVMLQCLYGSAMLFIKYECDAEHLDKCLSEEEKYTKIGFALTPLKGTGFLVVNFRNIWGAFLEGTVPFVDKVVNGSLNITGNFTGGF